MRLGTSTGELLLIGPIVSVVCMCVSAGHNTALIH